MSLEASELADLHDMFRSDLRKYASVACAIRGKDATISPLVFNAAQTLVHNKIEEQKARTGKVRVLVLKARQEGISTYVAARFWWRISLWPHLVCMVAADHRKRSETLWDIYQRYADNTPALLSPDHRNALRRQEVNLGNGSQLSIDTAEDPDLGRAMTIHLLHASELAAWARAETSFMSVIQAVPSDSGEVIVESTAQGVGNQFHLMWEQAEAGENDWLPIFLPWWIHEEYTRTCAVSLEAEIRAQPDPFEIEALGDGIAFEGAQHVLTLGQLAWRRMMIRDSFYGDTRMFRQEYPATALEAFLTAGGGFFDPDALTDHDKRTREPLQRGLMVKGKGIISFQPTERGPLSLWERPKPGGHYVIGVDTASGKQISARESTDNERGGRDFSVAAVGDALRRCKVAEFHARISPEAFADQIYMLGKFYGCDEGPEEPKVPALIAVERNHSSGQTVIRKLRDDKYPNMYMHRRLNSRYDRPSSSYGWITDSTTRRPMLDGLAAAIREGDYADPSKAFIRECRTFILADDGEPEAQASCHDDRVIATAIMLEMFRRHRHAVKGSLVADALAELETDHDLVDTFTGY